MWVRGLKLRHPHGLSSLSSVAPRVGAWIETEVMGKGGLLAQVAPRVGAWIETQNPSL